MSRKRVTLAALGLVAIALAVAVGAWRRPGPAAAPTAPATARRGGLDSGAGGGFPSFGGSDFGPGGGVAGEAASPRAGAAPAGPHGRVAGRVVDRGGAPVRGASVRASDEAGKPRGGASSGQDGAFAFDLPPGRYSIEARAQGLRPAKVEGILVREGEDASGIDLVLSSGARVVGRVTGPGGKPVRDATVEVRASGGPGGGRRGGGFPGGFGGGFAGRGGPPGGGPPPGGAPGGGQFGGGPGGRGGRGAPEGTARTDETGSYTVTGLTAGDKSVVARDERFPDVRPVDVTLADEGEGHADFTFVQGTYIAGHVRDARGGPIAGIEVTGAPEGGRGGGGGGRGGRGGGRASRRSTSGEDGGYRIDGLAGNLFTVSASGAGMQPVERSGIAAGAEDADLVLVPGAALAGTVVFQGGDSAPNATISVSGPTSTQVEAKEDGTFEVTGLAPGRYTLEARLENLATGKLETRVDRAQRVDGLQIVLAPTRPLVGRVLSPGGDPVAGAMISVQSADTQQQGGRGGFGGFGGGAGREIQMLAAAASAAASGTGASGGGPGAGDARTGADGSFQVQNVQAGRHLILAVHPDYPSGETAVDIPSDGDPPPVVIKLPPGGAIAGTAFDDMNQPLAGARVIATGGGHARTADVQGDGSFMVQGLASANYNVRVMAPPRDQGQPPRTISQSVGVIAGETTRVELKLAPGATVLGHLTRAGTPVPQTAVALMPTDGPFAAQRADTLDDGSFRFTDVPPGTYQLRSGNAVAALSVVQGDVAMDLVIPTGSVAGVVLDAQTGDPVSGAGVLLYVPAATGATPGPAIDQVFGRAQTAGDGGFHMDGVDPGTYSLRVSATDFATSKQDGIAVTAAQPTTVSFRLDEGGTVVGTVRDESGNPVAGARVTAHNESLGISDPRGSANVVTGQDGTFTLRALAAATYALVAAADGFASSSAQVAFDGTALHVDLKLTIGGALTVHAVDGTGKPVAGAVITMTTLPPGAASPGRLATDADGLAKFAHLGAGPYAAEASVPGLPPVGFEASVSEGGAADARVVVAAPAPPPPGK
jgi:hypothetical protein